jgi:AAA15 family ATPase/GTPase
MTPGSSEESEMLVPVFQHATSKGSAKFELNEESDGTQRLYGLAAPVIDVLKRGRILVVDELDSSLHPLLVRRLISMFHDPSMNKAGAQLIFSTHDTSLLDHSLFRRDQVWFTEKDSDQATRIYPLTDFSPRKREAWERGYLTGRYGAVPFFSELPDILKHTLAQHGKSKAIPTAA